MIEIIQVLAAVFLVLMPLFIYTEICRQGKARSKEAAEIIALLKKLG